MSIWKSNKQESTSVENRKKLIKKIGEKAYEFFDVQAQENGYLLRDGQLEMSCEIIQGLQENVHVLVEAGVGIGKSFAYIVPILLYIKEFNKPVVIATSTIALQEQLSKDIESVKKMLSISCEVIVAKGQVHFLCRNRLDMCFTHQFINSNEENHAIYTAIKDSGHEKSDWKVTIPDKIWNKINVHDYNPQQCRFKCSYHNICYYYNLRQRMLDTNGIIICNQDLLAVNLKKKEDDRKQLMSDKIGVIVIDEAHNLESRVRSSLTTYVSYESINNALDGACKSLDYFDNEFTKEVDKVGNQIEEAFNLLYKQVRKQDNIASKTGQEIERYYVKENNSIFIRLTESLDDISYRVNMEFGKYLGNRVNKNYDEEKEKLEDIVNFFRSFIIGKKSEDIFWMEKTSTSKGSRGIKLFRCPKEVNKIINRILFKSTDVPVILTSATLTNEKSKEDPKLNYLYYTKTIGFPEHNVKILESIESPFNYDEHAMVYYTEHMPHPTHKRNEFIQAGVKEIIKLLNISNGKALILFTAKTDLHDVYELLKKENLPFQVLKNDGNSKQAEILAKFKKDTNSVLLGTGSFWEGINIEGEPLSHVIIFKLPFPINEPINDYKYSQAEDGLMDVYVPEMIIKLKQGIGRLIRSERDKGIVSIIDSRVGDTSSAKYKKIIWNSLPIKNKTNQIEVIKKFYNDVVNAKK